MGKIRRIPQKWTKHLIWFFDLCLLKLYVELCWNGSILCRNKLNISRLANCSLFINILSSNPSKSLVLVENRTRAGYQTKTKNKSNNTIGTVLKLSKQLLYLGDNKQLSGSEFSCGYCVIEVTKKFMASIQFNNKMWRFVYMLICTMPFISFWTSE